MKAAIAVGLTLVAFVLPGAASAHFKMEQPPDVFQTNATGDPAGGDQKTAPCGKGTTPSNVVTQVRAGSMLHIKLVETIAHGGHYRVALSSNRGDFVTPTPVVENNDCKSAPIQTTPVAPVIADGLFQHGQNDFPSGKVWETDVKMPDQTCDNCTLQILEFMTPHAPGCFYFHCANVKIVPADASIPDGGATIVVDAGGGGGGNGGDGGAGGGGEAEDDSDGGAAARRLRAAPQAEDGCNVGSASTSSFVTLAPVVAMALSMLRRRRRR